MTRKNLKVILMAVSVLLGIVILGCSESKEENFNSDLDALQDEISSIYETINALQVRLSSAETGSTKALVIASLPLIDARKFHDIDEQINSNGLIDKMTPGIIKNAITTLEQDFWPSELDAHTKQFHTVIEKLLNPVLADDVESSRRPATIAHAIAHHFEEAAMAFISSDTIPKLLNLNTVEESGSQGDDIEQKHHEENHYQDDHS